MKLKRANMDRFKSEMESKDEKIDSHFQLWKLIQKSNLRHIQWCTGSIEQFLAEAKVFGVLMEIRINLWVYRALRKNKFRWWWWWWWWWRQRRRWPRHFLVTSVASAESLREAFRSCSSVFSKKNPAFSDENQLLVTKMVNTFVLKHDSQDWTYSEGVVLFQMILHASSVPISQLVRKRSVHPRAHSAYWWASVWWSRRRSCCREVLRRLTWPCFWRWVAMSWEMNWDPCLFRVYRGLY